MALAATPARGRRRANRRSTRRAILRRSRCSVSATSAVGVRSTSIARSARSSLSTRAAAARSWPGVTGGSAVRPPATTRSASKSSSGGACLSTSPSAPAMRRMSWRPSPVPSSGSSRTRSGAPRRASSSASSAVPALPTGTSPGSPRSSAWSPARSAGWGSTMATRVTRGTIPAGGKRTVSGVPDATPALELERFTKRYDDGLLALDAVDLVVPAGEFFGLLGPNGAGKTTLISAVCNLIRTTSGEARVFGHPHECTEARRMIGLAEQDINLDRFLDVEETLVYHGGYYGMSRADARRRAGEMMDVFDLRAKATTRAPKLSGGMRRRLLLARALMHEPRLVILDEPTAGVDFELRLELWRYIRRLHEEGTSILLTTHYLEEAEELCEDIALIQGGRVIARDSSEGLRAAYDAGSLADVYVKAMAAPDVRSLT